MRQSDCVILTQTLQFTYNAPAAPSEIGPAALAHLDPDYQAIIGVRVVRRCVNS
jgi:hypothetical protein